MADAASDAITTGTAARTDATATGTMTAIHIAASAGEPMSGQAHALAIAGRGLDGDRYAEGRGHYSDTPSRGGGREVTLIASEALAHLRDDHGLALSTGETRRNLTTQDVDLEALIGRTFRIGQATLAGIKPCPPCGYLDELTGRSLKAALRDVGGLRANVVVGGMIRVGDSVIVDVSGEVTG